MTQSSRSVTTLVSAAVLGVSLVAAPLVALPAVANPEGTGIVISEAYLGGGNSGATYNAKFVELYNPTLAPVSLNGTSLQYRSATGAANPTTVVALTGTIPAKGHYLMKATDGANGAPLPTTADATGTFNVSASSGTIFLASQATALAAPAIGSVANRPGVLDVLGYGTSNTYETTPAGTPASSTTTTLNRTATGTDTDVNSADFTAAAPTPTNTGGGGTVEPPVDPPVATPATIAEIQGTTDVSPKANVLVKTAGVVTAAYPTGGFAGFYIQTPGTGGAVDLGTHASSDGVFVFTGTVAAPVAVGDYVEVTGTVTEFFGLTEITITAPTDVVKPGTAGIVAPTPATVGLPTTDASRESLEGMLLAPQGDFTVTNNYTTNQYGEIGLAAGTTPLVNPTVTALPGAPAAAAAAANKTRAVTLDDGASTNYLSAANKSKPVPYLSTTEPVRIGAKATLTKPVIFDFRNSVWKFQPTAELVPATAAAVQPATFANTRTAAPRSVGGDIRMATFNVLNYFSTTGDSITGCTYFTDRAGTPITVNSGCDARGAATTVSFERQQAKIVAAINKLDAHVISLEEIENSARFGKPRDTALAALVTALNAAAGSDVWAFVPSPAVLPATEDVIRTAFIYKKAAVELVGDSKILTDSTAFSNARQPLAQAFQLVGDAGSKFLTIVNHFKSKGSGTGEDADKGDGQGASNLSRVNQATALVAFADTMKTDSGIDRVFLTGDFNAYDKEDPIRVITDAGYISQEAKSGEYTYAFGGSVGSLDHVFASPAADATVTDVDVWNINSVESVALEYSRYNNNVTDFYVADAFRSSDHDPAVVGLDIASPTNVDINLLGINDFHGRIDANTVKFAGTVEQLRAEYGDDSTLFLSAGDNIGASLFASASQKDIPTIDVLNALELKASAVGNHEFDQGSADLNGRVNDAANWDFLGANVYQAGTTTPAMQEYALFDVNGVSVGVIGAVTQETPSLVTPTGIASLSFGEPVAAVNRVAAQLSDGNAANGEADVLVAAYHEGASSGGATATLEQELAITGSAFTRIVTQTSATVDAIYTGHTHKQYAWNAQVPGAAVGVTRPVLQTGDYGSFVGQVVLNYDIPTGTTTTVKNRDVARTTIADATLTAAYPRVAAVKTIVDAALAQAAVIGNQPVGSVTADITRACAGGTSPCAENRAAPSALGTLVANSLRESLSTPAAGGAEIGIVNPGGMRAELLVGADGVITYAEANAVLPFVNNLWTTTLTGAQFKTVLEQQWQRNADNTVPSRPYLQLGLSDNVNYTFDATRPEGDRITGIWVNGSAIVPAQGYRIGSFNFLLTGGDNFREFTKGTNTRDSGQVDRDAWISYITANSPLSPSFAARQAQVTGAPTAVVTPGDVLSFTVSGLNLTSLGAPKNTSLALAWSGSTATLAPASVDANGSSTVTVTVPADAPAGSVLTLTAAPSGTVVRVAIAVNAAPITAPVAAADSALTSALEGKISTDKSEYLAGETVSVTVGAAYAGDYVSTWLRSKAPVNLGGWQVVNAQGKISVTIPAGTKLGKHQIAVQDVDGNVIGWTEIKVAKDKKI